MNRKLATLCIILVVGGVVVLSTTFVSVPEAYGATTRSIEVDNIPDDQPEGGCTLREAIDVANAGLGPGIAPNGCIVTESGGDIPINYEINLPSYTYTLTGAAGEDGNLSGDLDIIASMTINGQGTSKTFIDGGGTDRVFHIPITGLELTFTISNMTVQNGYVDVAAYDYGGGIAAVDGEVIISNSTVANSTGYSGGGIYISSGSVYISNSTVTNNTASYAGGGIYNPSLSGEVFIDSSNITNNEAKYGGGIVYRRVSISNSTVSNNSSYHSGGGIRGGAGAYTFLNVINSSIASNTGGGIYIRGSNFVNIANSTISGNITNGSGGGILSEGTLNLTNVTVTDNIADYNQDGSGSGGGISGKANIRQSIIAGNTDRSGSGPDCYGTFVSYQYNLIGINTGCVVSFPAGRPNGNNDYVGTGGLPLDPLLGGLTGEPSCYMLQLSSTAIDKVPEESCTFISQQWNPLFNNGDPVTTDQLGTTRDSTCDIGAYEVPAVGIQVFDGMIEILDDTGMVNFGSPLVGEPVTKTFMVLNIGKTTALTLSELSVPAGFSIASDFGSTTVLTGTQTTFEIQLDATEAITYSGQLSFTTNVENRNPFNFEILGTPFQPVLLSLTKTASSSTVTLGQVFTYTLVISNVGLIDASNVLVSDTIPAELDFIGPVVIDPPSAGTPGVPPTLVNDLTINAGERITVSFPVRVMSGCGTVITNTASVSSMEPLSTKMSSVDINIACPTIYLHLPLIFNDYPPEDVENLVDVVKLGVVDWIGYPGNICVYGYTTGITPSPVYSVTLAIDVVVIPYCEPPVYCDPYPETHYVDSLLDATLPDQKNPFSYCLMYGKGGYGYGAVELASASLNPPNGRVIYPLTVTSLTKEGSEQDTIVYGTVKNDTDHRLTELRVVGMAGLCSPKCAVLGATILDSGEETSFIFNGFFCPTPPFQPPPEAMLEISAQGVVEP